jgi:N6-L-threonylcarbamoyladenine synthase
MLILGIETSCDETAAAVVEGNRVRSDVVHTQVELHAEYGGVVPELASRDHLHNARPVIDRALVDAGVTLDDIDAIAVTCRPGLSGALLIGTQVASALAWAADKPLIGVDHLVGHLLAVFLDFPDTDCPPPPPFPFIGLVASGGHTAIYRVDGPSHEKIVELGATRDDAAGEAYDKVAKLLGLGYPGGPIVDRLANEGDPTQVALSRPMPNKQTLEFSFSGLKTNVARWVQKNGVPENDDTLRNLCAAFQRVVVDTLIEKSIAAAKAEGIKSIALAGGVSANSALRSRGRQLCANHGIDLVVPHFRACTDNAAMIAYAGSFGAEAGRDDRGSLDISPRTILPRITRKGGGMRTGNSARGQG